MSSNNHQSSSGRGFPAVPSGNASEHDQRSSIQEPAEFRPVQEREQEQENAQGPSSLHQDHQSLPSLQDSFGAFDAYGDYWTRQGQASRRAFDLPSMTPQQAASLRQTNTGGDAGDSEGLYGHAEVDYLSKLQVSKRLNSNQTKRPREADPVDRSGREEDLQSSDRRLVKHPCLGPRPGPGEDVQSISSAPVSQFPGPFTGSGRGRGGSTGQAQRTFSSSSSQQSPYYPPSQWAPDAGSTPAYRPHTSGRESILQPAPRGGNSYGQPPMHASQQQQRTGASSPLLLWSLPARMQPQQSQIPPIPFVNGQYQSTAWGRLDGAAAACVAAPAARHAQGDYGGGRLPPPPKPRTARPAPNTKKTYTIPGYLVRALSGFDRTELYRALSASVLAMLQLREQFGEQKPRMWVKLKDYRYKEARDRLKDSFAAVQPEAGDKEFNDAIPNREDAADGWDDYLEDWDLPYRSFLSKDERSRWLEYYWSSEEREKEKEAIAPLAFDGAFLQSEKVGRFWRQDIQKWEFGTKVHVVLEGAKPVVLDME